VLAQRLVRKVCTNCSKEYFPTPRELAALHLSEAETRQLTLRKGEGCGKCRGTGYYGRIAIFEVMPISDDIRKLIHHNAGAQEIQRQALKEGMHTLRQSAIHKMNNGVTTLEEVIRVTGGYL
jgi:type IV pilus assembly protein PilB